MSLARNLPCLVVICCLLLIPQAWAAKKNYSGYKIENDFFLLRLIPRTPQQMAAFYEARGFPKSAIKDLDDTCFITVILRNKSRDIVWLDLQNWKFTDKNSAIRRLDRVYWKKHWQSVNLPLRFQSTFRWTLLPEKLDFRPDEGEGGNIILDRTNSSFSISAMFAIGNEGKTSIPVSLDDIRCAEDTKK